MNHPRPDVGACYGTRFTNSGYGLTVSGLAPGYYQISVYAHGTVSGLWPGADDLRDRAVSAAGVEWAMLGIRCSEHCGVRSAQLMTKHPIRTLLGLPFTYRQKRLGRERKPLDEAEFVRETTVGGGDRAAAILLWKKLQECVYAVNFTPYPSDNLENVFGIAEEELDEDLILSILRELSVPPPSDEELSAFGRINTPLRVAQLVARCRADNGAVSGPKIQRTHGSHEPG